MGLEICKFRKLPLSGGFGGPSKLRREEVGDVLPSLSLSFDGFPPNFDLIFVERSFDCSDFPLTRSGFTSSGGDFAGSSSSSM